LYNEVKMNRVQERSLFVYKLVIVIITGMLLSGCIADKPSRLLLAPDAIRTAGASDLITVTMPVGAATGNVDEKLTYSVGIKASVGGDYTYGFNWGDGTYSWATSGIASHSWSKSGIYIVRAQARCNEVISEWSPGKVVMIGSAILSRSPLDRPDQAVRYVTSDTDEIKAAVQAIFSTGWKKHYNDLDALREWVATNISYKDDRANFGVNDYWQFPVETLERGSGDCEDFAILLCALLRAYGVPPDQVYVAVGTPKGMKEYHAYLIERYSKGIWNMIEPQIDTVTSSVSFTFLDWALTNDYSSDLYCFNDQYYFRGFPGSAAGIYEVNVWHSFWPFFPCASTTYERQFKPEDKIEGTIEWLGNESIVLEWTLNIYGPSGDTILTWSGNDTRHDFVVNALKPGTYKVEIVKRDYSPRNIRLVFNPPGWKKSKG
jgi:predicted transglutaminase-like cysteine proteinase